MKEIFITSYINNQQSPEFYIYDSGKSKIVPNIDNYTSSNFKIVTFDIYSLNEFQKKQKKDKLSNIIDIESMARQIEGKPKSEFTGDPPWVIWQLMSNSFYKEDKSKQLEKIRQIYYGILEKNKSTKDDFYEFNLNLKKLYESLRTELDTKNESKRFFDIEKKVTEIILETNYSGIALNKIKINDRIRAINNELYKIRNELQLKYKIFSADDQKHIIKNLKKIGFEFIAKSFDPNDSTETENYYHLLKLFKNKDKLVELLYLEKKHYKNITSLLRIGSLEEDIVFPIFESLGTITSRILVRYPLIQQLSREYRDIVIAGEKKELVYIDYSQFEAGILANECEDEFLLECYENDIYTSLSEKVFGNKDYRDICKQIFFKYCYGAKTENMESLLQDFKPNNLNDKELKEKINTFFNSFPKLESYRKCLENELKNERKIGSKNGNYRYIDDYDDISDINWTMSQRIQGTASLILKKAIIQTYESDKEIEFLIPMHDAVLYQVPQESKEDKIKVLKQIYESVFREVCPKIKNPLCKIKGFTE